MCDQVHVKTMVLEKTKQAGVAEAGKESSEEDWGVEILKDVEKAGGE